MATHMATQAKEARRGKLGQSFCLFERGGSRFAVPVVNVREMLSGVAPIPDGSGLSYVVGLIVLRNERMPLVQADAWLGVTPRRFDATDQVLVLELGEARLAVLVDRVREVRRVDADAIRPVSLANASCVSATFESEGEVKLVDVARLIGEVAAQRHLLPAWGRVAEEEDVRRRERGEDHCIFTRGPYDLALPVTVAREMLSGEIATAVPQAPAHVVGVLNLRGDVLPLVQIDRWLELTPRPYSPNDVIVVVETRDILVGLVVDRVRDVRPLEAADIRPSVGSAARRPFRGRWQLAGASEVIVLDAERLIEEAVELSTAGFRRALSAPGMTWGSEAGL